MPLDHVKGLSVSSKTAFIFSNSLAAICAMFIKVPPFLHKHHFQFAKIFLNA